MKIFKPSFLLFLFLFLGVKAFAFTDPTHIDELDESDENVPTSVKFSSDGKTMFHVGVNSKSLRQYSLSTGFDLSTASEETAVIDLSEAQGAAQDIAFNSDGTILFIIGTEALKDGIHQWNLNTPYDISDITATDGVFTDIEIASVDPRGFKFSNDGKKLFVVDQQSNGKVYEYELSTAYNLSGMVLSNTLLLGITVGRRQGIDFSSDGYKLFITNSATHGSNPVASKNFIREYSLSSPFNITNPTNNGDFQPNYATLFKLTGLTFNNDGSKMFHTDFHNNDIHEYTLSCGFGVKTCTDPTNDKDDVASVEAQSNAAKQLIQHNTYPVLNRMEWLRRNSNRVNLTNQNIKFQFNNEILNSLSNSLIPLYFSEDNKTKSNYQNSSWSFWSEGSISIGKVGDTSVSSPKDINTSAITLGIDKKSENNMMRGIAFRLGNDDVDVGNLGSALDMSSFSLTFYESRPRGENRFIDHLIGASFINSDLINNSGSISTIGERSGEQLYGSLSLRDTLSNNKFNFTPKIKMNYGITHFAAYTETGATGLNLQFDDQYIGNVTSSLGTVLDNTYELEAGTFVPFFDFEYYADMSPSSKQTFSYASDGTAYTLKNLNNSTHNIISSMGFDFISENGLSLMSKFTRDQAKSTKSDSFIVALDYKNSQKSFYTLSVENFNTKLSHNNELNGFKINLDTHYNILKSDPDYGVYLKISNQR